MYTSKFLLYILAALIATASAQPVRHGRRGTCRRPHHTITVSPTATSAAATVSSSVAASSTTKAASDSSSVPQIAPSSTGKPASSSIPAAAPSTTKDASSSDAAPTSTKSGSSSAAPAPTSPSSGGGALKNLFPIGRGSSSWTTAPSDSNALPLSDGTLRPQQVMRSVPHKYTKAPDGKSAMQAFYPKGSYTFGHSPQGGFSFYAPGPASVDLTKAKEATFGYSVFMPDGFDPVLGGKLPGLYGGNSDGEATGCSGGRRDDACFSVRLMWRAEAAGELYTYLPPSFDANKAVCNVPNSDCNPTYGASVGRGSFSFNKGAWTTVSERVKLNDVGQSNGEIQLFVNGKSVINVDGLVLRNSDDGRIHGIQCQTFFGGSKPQFRTPTDQELWFSDFSVAVTKTF